MCVQEHSRFVCAVLELMLQGSDATSITALIVWVNMNLSNAVRISYLLQYTHG